ncbi:MAG: PLP-dependent transferase, partial [Chloroflexi bacterium]|nr:PLP-dependent transferase [Chloroflexota bacterium]
LTSTFSFDDVDVATEVMTGRTPGFSYSRGGNPTVQHLANKYALLEGIDLIRANPDSDPSTLVRAIPFASGMAAISAGILSRVRGGDTLIAQRSLYNTTYQFLTNILPRYNINVIWQDDLSPEAWDAALTANPKTTLRRRTQSESKNDSYLHRVARQPDDDRVRHQSHHRSRPSPRRMGHHRQHVCLTLLSASAHARC